MTDCAKDVAGILSRMVDNANAPATGRPQVLVGLVGRGIQASRSPIMHERESARLGLSCRYVLIDFDLLGFADAAVAAVIEAASALGFAGLNVTHPLKQAVIPHLERLSAEAEAIGAVNTVVFKDGEAIGHNTDGWGFATGLKAALPGLRPRSVVQFGAGGAGAAVAHALIGLGVKDLCIVDERTDRASALASRLATREAVVRAGTVDAVAVADGIVNATPVGMAKYPGTPFDTAMLSPHQWVADIVYVPPETALLRQAAARGCTTVPGTHMAVYQAVRAFELFTGMAADAGAMTQHFEAAA